jgi:hypothetical protein
LVISPALLHTEVCENIALIVITVYLKTLFSVVKVKHSHSIPVEAQGERIFSSYSFTTSALDGG